MIDNAVKIMGYMVGISFVNVILDLWIKGLIIQCL